MRFRIYPKNRHPIASSPSPSQGFLRLVLLQSRCILLRQKFSLQVSSLSQRREDSTVKTSSLHLERMKIFEKAFKLNSFNFSLCFLERKWINLCVTLHVLIVAKVVFRCNLIKKLWNYERVVTWKSCWKKIRTVETSLCDSWWLRMIKIVPNWFL